MQEKLNKGHHKVKQKLFNSQLNKLGNKVGMVYISTEVLNMYRDKRYIPTKAESITCYLDLPRDEIELFGSNDHGTPGFNIYEVLPKYMWTSFENNCTVDDFILRQLWLNDEKFVLQVFQITKILVKGKTYLQQKRYQIAPMNVLEGARGDNQMEMALSSIITGYRADKLPTEGTEIPILESTDESDFMMNPNWYGD